MIDQASWIAIFPEALLLLMACVIAIADLGVKSPLRTLTYALSVGTLLVLAAMEAFFGASGFTLYGFSNMVVSDSMSAWLKCFASLAVMVSLVYARPYALSRDMLRGGELFTLSLFGLLGMFVMMSGNNLLVIYLGLELLTLSSYALVALRRDKEQATEAAMKYFVLGAMASGFLLYGMSMLYGATGTLDITMIHQAIVAGHIQHQVLVFGLVFIVAGLAFKLGAVPFHMWVPDVYQGAPTGVTLMIAGAPKLAAFAIVIRLLVEGLLPLALDWQQMLMVLSVASLVIGNFAAIAQTNIKRMLAYSTISQVGFILLGLLSGVVDGNAVAAANAYSSAMFYVITYVLTTLATFGIIMLLSAEGFESEEIADFAGLNQRSPLYAGVMALCMFSLAGIPPLVGFFAKLSVLQALVLAGGSVHIGLAVFAVLMSLVGAFYYLRVVKVMYFDAPISLATVRAPGDVKLVLGLNALLLLILGLLPGGLMTLCAESILQMMGT
jgi:NADH-quinone oxidoreductase subunit N